MPDYNVRILVEYRVNAKNENVAKLKALEEIYIECATFGPKNNFMVNVTPIKTAENKELNFVR